MSSNNKKSPALGRGLSALLSDTPTELGGTSMVEIQSIEANPFNPRTKFEKERLDELAASIKELGIIQPLTLRQISTNRYQIISGERRFRAAQLAGITQIPAYIRVANDQAMLEMALVENIQRENLNAIEIGLSYLRLIEECKYTQSELGNKISKSRSDIANHLRLLKLPAELQAAVRDNEISMGHARALLSISNEQEQLAAFKAILSDQLSVREIEQWGKKVPAGNTKTSSPPVKTALTKSLEKQLQGTLGTKVLITQNSKGAGKLTLNFKSTEELDRIIGQITNQ